MSIYQSPSNYSIGYYSVKYSPLVAGAVKGMNDPAVNALFATDPTNPDNKVMKVGANGTLESTSDLGVSQHIADGAKAVSKSIEDGVEKAVEALKEQRRKNAMSFKNRLMDGSALGATPGSGSGISNFFNSENMYPASEAEFGETVRNTLRAMMTPVPEVRKPEPKAEAQAENTQRTVETATPMTASEEERILQNPWQRPAPSVARSRLKNFNELTTDVGNSVALGSFMMFGRLRDRVFNAVKSVTRMARMNPGKAGLGLVGLGAAALALTGHLPPGTAEMMHAHISSTGGVGHQATNVAMNHVGPLVNPHGVNQVVNNLTSHDIQEALNASYSKPIPGFSNTVPGGNLLQVGMNLNQHGVGLNDLANMNLADLTVNHNVDLSANSVVSMANPANTASNVHSLVQQTAVHTPVPAHVQPSDHVRQAVQHALKGTTLGNVDGINVLSPSDKLQAMKIASNLHQAHQGLGYDTSQHIAHHLQGHAKAVEAVKALTPTEFHDGAMKALDHANTDTLNRLSAEAPQYGYSVSDLLKEHAESVAKHGHSAVKSAHDAVQVKTDLGGGTHVYTEVSPSGETVSHVSTPPGNEANKPGFFHRVANFFTKDVPNATIDAGRDVGTGVYNAGRSVGRDMF